jgi:hypothetical protein
MSKPIRYESLAEPLNDEERELMDPNAWDWESAEERPPVANPGIVLEIRFSREEIRRVTTAASEAGVSVDAFVTRAALACASHGVPR